MWREPRCGEHEDARVLNGGNCDRNEKFAERDESRPHPGSGGDKFEDYSKRLQGYGAEDCKS